MSDLYGLSSEITLKATNRMLGDVNRLGVKVRAHTKLKFLKLEI